MTEKNNPLSKIILGESIGTFILVFFGCGVVGLSVLKILNIGLIHVAAVWGVAVTIAIYLTKDLSGAHINPAVTVALAVWKKAVSVRDVFVYISAQMIGAICAAVLLFLLFAKNLKAFEQSKGLVRGEVGSELSAMMFGEYFPNPAMSDTLQGIFANVGPAKAFIAEFTGTALLVLAVFIAISDTKRRKLVPIRIGVALFALIYIFAPLTQAGLNPARDFGPRLVSYFVGWGGISLPGPSFGFLIYIIAPILGALFGGGIYQAAQRISDKNDADKNTSKIQQAKT